jgi:hypothetical protein
MNISSQSDALKNRSIRYRDDGRWLGAFLGDHCDVRCPRCERLGVVRYECIEDYQTIARFACAGCALALQSPPDSTFSDRPLPNTLWFGRVRLSGSRICGYCGARWLRRTLEAHVSEIRPVSFNTFVVCPECSNEYPLTMKASLVRDMEIGCEPMFGLALARSEPVRPGKNVWAYNRAHLREIKLFVGSQLRERACVANSSYVSRLPAWIKSAHNRNKVCSAIVRIEKRMNELEECQ